MTPWQDEGDRRGRVGERRLTWPPAPGTDLEALVAELAAAIDGAAEAGRALALIEIVPGAGEEVLRLAERLAAHWQAAGLSCLVVDGHPLAPFSDGLYAGSPEGFTEILHYGLSPAAAAQPRPQCPGLWIPAGGRWMLPLESPAEPGLSLHRLLAAAERVLLLADAGDAEGLLPALREHCHWRLALEREPARGAERAPVPGRQAAPRAAQAGPPGAAAPSRRRPERGRLRWPLLLLPAGALLLLLGIYLIAGPRRGPGPGPRSVERGAGEAFSPLPAPAPLPYAATARSESGADSAAGRLAEAAPAASAEEPRGTLQSGLAGASGLPAAPGREPAAVPPAAPVRSEAARVELARRFEAPGAWRQLQTAAGPFYIHLDSFRDSSLAAAALGSPAARRLGGRLAPATEGEQRWYRLWLGPFPDLPSAAACRDSLLDRAGEDYCRIVTPTP